MLRLLLPLFGAFCLALPAAWADDTVPEDDAVALVERFHDGLIAMMKDELDFAARAERLQEVVRDGFNLTTVSRVSIGAGWRQLEREERSQVRAAIHELIAVTYADRFTSFNEHAFETVGADSSRADRVVVRTRLRRIDGDPVLLVYHVDNGGIFNVIADGVSDLSLRRAQYSAVYRSHGFDALLGEIAQQIETLRRDHDDDAG